MVFLYRCDFKVEVKGTKSVFRYLSKQADARPCYCACLSCNVPVRQESRAEILQAFQTHSWLNMLHLHVGSQGLALDTVIAG